MDLNDRYIVHLMDKPETVRDEITVSYKERSEADSEAVRLAKKHASDDFVFEVLRCKRVSKTHICVSTNVE